MKHTSAWLGAFCMAGLWFSPTAMAGHGFRIDGGNTTGCMSTWTTDSGTSGASNFIPGTAYGTAVDCSATGSPAILFPNSVLYNDSATVDLKYTATSGQMYQYYSGGITASPDVAQVALWQITTGPSGVAETEIELNGWCTGGSGASFNFGGNTYAGGCGGSPTDLLFSTSTKALLGYVSDSSSGSTIGAVSTLAGWTQNGAAIGVGTVTAPEIDPSSAVAALTLLAGGLVVMRGRRGVQAVS